MSDAMTVFARSTRSLIRQARARYTTDLLSWPYRDEFASVWTTVERIPGWFNEGSAALLYGLMRESPPQTVVEIGSYLGRSTAFFGLTLRQVGGGGRVGAIDPSSGDRQRLEGLAVGPLPSFELFRQHSRASAFADIGEAQ